MATFSVSGIWDPFADFLKPLCRIWRCHCPLGDNAENTFLEDSAGVCFGNLDIGAVVLGVDGTQVCWHDFIASVGLEAVLVSLVTDLANHVEILISPQRHQHWGLHLHLGLSPHHLHHRLTALHLGLRPVAATWGPHLPIVVCRENCWAPLFGHLTG